MSRKKKDFQPLFNVRGEFHDSLENAIGRLMVLMQAVETALELKQIAPAAEPIVRKALTDMRHAVINEWDGVQ